MIRFGPIVAVWMAVTMWFWPRSVSPQACEPEPDEGWEQTVDGEPMPLLEGPQEPTQIPADFELGRFEHEEWDTIVSLYVSPDGGFDYDRLRRTDTHRALLQLYLDRLAQASIGNLPAEELLAFWINAYNACVVRGVLEYQPDQSVLQIEGFFDRMQCRVAGLSLSLNDIENDRIRRFFFEPRIHFALNAGARGCPRLRAEAYRGDRLAIQLEDQTRTFLRATTAVNVNEMEVRLNRLLEWFGHDFDHLGGVREFVAARLSQEQARCIRLPSYELVFEEFDWRLNSAP